MAEICNFPRVSSNDYKRLVELKSCVEINFARLKSCELESEMSNTMTMKQIESKFLQNLMLEWMRYLGDLPTDRRRNVFPEFL